MPIPFEPTRSYIYRASRYELLPRTVDIAHGFGDEPFLLRELTKQVLTETYTPEQLDIPGGKVSWGLAAVNLPGRLLHKVAQAAYQKWSGCQSVLPRYVFAFSGGMPG
jgi:hypothetical protein